MGALKITKRQIVYYNFIVSFVYHNYCNYTPLITYFLYFYNTIIYDSYICQDCRLSFELLHFGPTSNSHKYHLVFTPAGFCSASVQGHR